MEKELILLDINPIVERIKGAQEFPFFVFISGGSCVGKTFLATILKEYFSDECEMLMMDNYFKNKEDPTLPFFGGYPSFDLPNSYFCEELKNDIKKLSEKETISSPIYDIKRNQRVGQQTINPKKVIIVEGLYAVMMSQVIERQEQKLTIMVKANYENTLKRRIERDTKNYGFNEGKVVTMFQRLMEGPHKMYVSKQETDMIIENNYEGVEN